METGTDMKFVEPHSSTSKKRFQEYIRCEQSFPVNILRHTHRNVLPFSKHTPPCLHGFGTHFRRATEKESTVWLDKGCCYIRLLLAIKAKDRGMINHNSMRTFVYFFPAIAVVIFEATKMTVSGSQSKPG